MLEVDARDTLTLVYESRGCFGLCLLVLDKGVGVRVEVLGSACPASTKANISRRGGRVPYKGTHYPARIRVFDKGASDFEASTWTGNPT